MTSASVDTSNFSSSYAEARERILAASAAASAEIFSYQNPSFVGPQKEALFCDVLRFGPADAPKSMMMISGTHGLEALCGSAIQLQWIKEGASTNLADDTNAILIHALNPWGFAYFSRTTENNVDLNRNFIDWPNVPSKNAHYDLLHDVLCSPELTLGKTDNTRSLDAIKAEIGDAAYADALAAGQYHWPDGLFFGGKDAEWSNRTLNDALRRTLTAVKKVGLIDWHTGIGAYGKPFFLCFNKIGSWERQLAARWWGLGNVEVAQNPDRSPIPKYRGLVFHGVQRALPKARVAGAVIEFGTRASDDMVYALRADRWLKFEAAENEGKDVELDMLEAFCPSDPQWRRTVLNSADGIIRQLSRGLSVW